MTAQEDLAIVIPVWNLPEDLAFLLNQIADMKVFSEVIVADDGSDLDCNPISLGFSEERLGARLVYMRSDRQRGAGHARNIAFQSVTAEHTLFFDADDHLSENFPLILRQHVAADALDFTIFRHNDTRIEAAEGRKGTFASEEAWWDEALGGANRKLLSLQERATLSPISAYPWNKIYRSAFLRDNQISCSETPVHNDIRLHWLSFLYAERVQATRRIGAVHVIGDRDHHLTTRRGADRLCLGNIIAELTDQIRRSPGNQILMQRYILFVDNVCRWNLRQVDNHLLPQFTKMAVNTYLGFLPEEFRLYAYREPSRAAAIVELLLNEGV